MNLFLKAPMTKEELQEKLMLFTPRNITLVLNENHSTFLSVLEKRRKDLKLSLHRFFLYASDWVCESVVRYCVRRDPEALKVLRLFTNKYFAEADYSEKVNPHRLITKGRVYDLRVVFSRINAAYFDRKIQLHYTWFKRPKYRTFTSLTYGSYSKPLRLIRINDILDSSLVPVFFIDYIMYHEMLHHVCPPKVDSLGRNWIHTKEFKEREKLFEHYDKALDWEKKSARIFAKEQKRFLYGRS